MKTNICLAALAALLLSAAVWADEATDEYKQLMKPAATANVNLQRVVQTDLGAAAQAAADVQTTFAKIEEYWTKRGTADAIRFTKDVEAAAKETHDAAAAGNKDAAVVGAKKIGANCAGCHMAHRTRLPDGTFMLEP
jgi:cytochrome c556